MRFVFDVYMLADKLLDPTTANVVMDNLVKHLTKHSCTFDSDTITYLYASTADGSPLRKVIRDGAIQDFKNGWTGYAPKQEWDLPYEFLQDLLIETARLVEVCPEGRVGSTSGNLTSHREKDHYHRKVGQKVEKKAEQSVEGS